MGILKIVKSRFNATPSGDDFIQNWIKRAVERDGFVYIFIFGDRGLGKSTLALNLVYNAFKALYPNKTEQELWELTLKHIIFTIDDFMNAPNRKDLIRWSDGRIPLLLWDDFGLHTSNYAFLRGEGDRVGEFIEFFEVAREEVAVLIVTAATPEMLSPKLREAPQVYIEMVKRGIGKIYVKEDVNEKRKLFDKFLSWKYTIHSSKVPDWAYQEYRKQKRKAARIKKRMMELKREKYAAYLAEKLTPDEWQNEEILTARGILDMSGNVTRFGEMVIKIYYYSSHQLPPLPANININMNIIVPGGSGSATNGSTDYIMKKEIEKRLTKRNLGTLLRGHGVRLSETQVVTIRRALLDLLLNGKGGNGNGKGTGSSQGNGSSRAAGSGTVGEPVDGLMEGVV